MAISNITRARLCELFDCNAQTGILIRRIDKPPAKAGAIVSCRSASGYIVVNVDGRLYLVHRLIWLYGTGAFPKKHLDHIDGNPSNNRLNNLREATPFQNLQNQRRAKSNNKSCGLLGVTPNGKNWAASITADGKTHYLGTFTTPAIAHAAYLEAKRRFHPFGNL